MHFHLNITDRDRASLTDTQKNDHKNLLELVAKNQDKDAFEELFNYFAPRLKALMMKQFSDNDSAEDFMQETMLTVWNKANQFSSYRGSVSAWIFTIARNKRIDWYRKQGTKHYLDIDDCELFDDTPDSEDTILSYERDRLIAQATDNLPEEQQVIIKMSYMGDLTQAEIAEELGIPIGTVKSRMRLAYKKLRNSVEDVL